MDFEEIYQAYAGDLLRYTLSLCGDMAIAEDVVSEAFIKAIAASDKFRGDCSVKSWLCQIAKHCYVDYTRKHKRSAEFPAEIESASAQDPARTFLQKSDTMALHRALHALAEPYKEVFSLRVFGELRFAEIAALFGKTESWARVTFHRAKILLLNGDVK
ncbi:MAG: sigma-70 family RNA polymerase sigma factor [Clostridiales bacterium]|nr:sigma-70 family RNA polymerase sigma factor [Clostridiales bacterium]